MRGHRLRPLLLRRGKCPSGRSGQFRQRGLDQFGTVRWRCHDDVVIVRSVRLSQRLSVRTSVGRPRRLSRSVPPSVRFVRRLFRRGRRLRQERRRFRSKPPILFRPPMQILAVLLLLPRLQLPPRHSQRVPGMDSRGMVRQLRQRVSHLHAHVGSSHAGMSGAVRPREGVRRRRSGGVRSGRRSRFFRFLGRRHDLRMLSRLLAALSVSSSGNRGGGRGVDQVGEMSGDHRSDGGSDGELAHVESHGGLWEVRRRDWQWQWQWRCIHCHGTIRPQPLLQQK
mmetsp:Transcript_9582/g.20339  ORF Transcript_9582/g.20339 Transcript_9582/m.20339 type:complete len:281 (+) Transcript_9582:373-1215(+)